MIKLIRFEHTIAEAFIREMNSPNPDPEFVSYLQALIVKSKEFTEKYDDIEIIGLGEDD